MYVVKLCICELFEEMESNCSDHLITFDDDLKQFDPLSETNSNTIENASNEIYSIDLLGFDSLTPNTTSNQHGNAQFKPSRAPPPPPPSTQASNYYQPGFATETGYFNSSNSFSNTKPSPISFSNSITQPKTTYDEKSKLSQERSFMHHIDNSNKEKLHKKQSKFYDSAVTVNKPKTKQNTFVSYLPDDGKGTLPSKTK